MSGQPDDKRVYSEEEVASILRRSAKRQSESDQSPATGLTLAELKHLASEVGIDPAHVEAASRELDQGLVDERNGPESLFMPIISHYTHVISGEISEDQWEDVAEAIHTEYGAFGSIGQVGNQVTWTHSRFPEPSKQVSVASRNDRTRVAAHSDYSNLFPFLMSVLFGSSAVVAAITLEALSMSTGGAIMAIGMWVILYYFFARTLFANLSQKENRRAARLNQRIENLVGEKPARPPEVLPEGRLDEGILDEVPEAKEELGVPSPRTRTR